MPSTLSTRLFQQMRLAFSDPSSVVVTPASKQPSEMAVAEKLLLLDEVLSEVEQQAEAEAEAVVPAEELAIPNEGVITQAWSQSMSAEPQTLNPPQAHSTAKEALVVTPLVEAGVSNQVVEVEPTPELPVEVEGYIQHVTDHQNQLPQEIIIADDSAPVLSPIAQMRPVIVLPITPEIEKEGEKKNPQWSVKWLVEWSHKIMKMFSGKVVYNDG
ncbi:MAG: hypothetical protein M3Q81_05080 [bacterium]|nr:hypothetical protein [bacterium]